MADTPSNGDLLDAFRTHFHVYKAQVDEALLNATDETVLLRLLDDIHAYADLVEEHSHIFPAEELGILQANLALIRGDLEIQYQQTADTSHHGRPTVIERVYTGQPGRPRYEIDPAFLQFAHTHRSTSGVGHFLGISRGTVRSALLRQGLAEPQPAPFYYPHSENLDTSEDVDTGADLDTGEDEILDPHQEIPPDLPPDIQGPGPGSTGHISTISDEELDGLLLRLRAHFRRAGLSILDGLLRQLGHRVPRERVRESLSRIDPVQRVFQRIRIRRREYSVAGPNALWHHDGQHGLIRWGIVIHGFIDGYSRLITGLRAHDNNRGTTVLQLFLEAARLYGVPSRMRGDHGVENIETAVWMETNCGFRRGSYIWGRSIHNVRIERLWVDVTAQIGATWGNLFMFLELHHGLDINNVHHIWLLHYLFLPTINDALALFTGAWNEHRIQMRRGPSRSPADLFGFDSLVLGVRGHALDEELTVEELEVYGVDWEALNSDNLLESHRVNNTDDTGTSSWVGELGVPQRLNEVPVESPSGPFTPAEMTVLEASIVSLRGLASDDSVVQLWTYALAVCRVMNENLF